MVLRLSLSGSLDDWGLWSDGPVQFPGVGAVILKKYLKWSLSHFSSRGLLWLGRLVIIGRELKVGLRCVKFSFVWETGTWAGPERFLSVFLFLERVQLIRAGGNSPVKSLHCGIRKEKEIVLVHPILCRIATLNVCCMSHNHLIIIWICTSSHYSHSKRFFLLRIKHKTFVKRLFLTFNVTFRMILLFVWHWQFSVLWRADYCCSVCCDHEAGSLALRDLGPASHSLDTGMMSPRVELKTMLKSLTSPNVKDGSLFGFLAKQIINWSL